MKQIYLFYGLFKNPHTRFPHPQHIGDILITFEQNLEFKSKAFKNSQSLN
jgi:hypothetical protein